MLPWAKRRPPPRCGGAPRFAVLFEGCPIPLKVAWTACGGVFVWVGVPRSPLLNVPPRPRGAGADRRQPQRIAGSRSRNPPAAVSAGERTLHVSAPEYGDMNGSSSWAGKCLTADDP